jgi:Spy/CpxP family protein refolding chaperone
MKGNLVWVLLVISMGFNVGVGLSLLSTQAKQHQLKTPEGRTQLIVERLNLNPQQAQAFKRLRSALGASIQEFRQTNKAELDEFWAEIVKDEPDREHLRRLVAESVADREQIRLLAVDHLWEFFQVLTPAQVEQCVRMVRERQGFSF